MMREVELKFAIHPSFNLLGIIGSADVVEVKELSPFSLVATYYDTPDLRLARNGVTLRRRGGDEGSTWTLKLPTGDERAVIRDEIDFAGHSEEIPPEAIEIVTGFTRAAELFPVATLETNRGRWKLIGDGDAELAVVYDDEVAVIENDRVLTRFREIELESLGIGIKKFLALGEAFEVVGAVPAEPVPKAIRALGPRATAPPDIPAGGELAPFEPASRAVRAMIARSADRLVSHHAAARLGSDEGVHQMRVALRRLRSDLRTFSRLVDPVWAAELIPELEWLADLLGGVRDLDVLVTRLEGSGNDLRPDLDPLLDAFAGALADAKESLYSGLRSERYRDLLEKIVRSAQNPPVTPEATRHSADVFPPLVDTAWKRLRKAVRAARKDPSDEALHRVRVRAKRVRYAAEAVAPALGRRTEAKAGAFARAAVRLQDVLGEHQDAVVAQARIRASAGDQLRGSRALAAGRVLERQARFAAEARNAWSGVWKRLDQKKHRSWLTG